MEPTIVYRDSGDRTKFGYQERGCGRSIERWRRSSPSPVLAPGVHASYCLSIHCNGKPHERTYADWTRVLRSRTSPKNRFVYTCERQWPLKAECWQRLSGSICFADITGVAIPHESSRSTFRFCPLNRSLSLKRHCSTNGRVQNYSYNVLNILICFVSVIFTTIL